MDTETNNNRSTELLTDWSKWLITLNFLSGTGCIVGLKTAGESTNKVGAFFFAAIIFFSLSAICSTLFVLLLAKQGLQKPGRDARQFTWLASLQWVLFTFGVMFVLIWIGFLSKVF